MGRVRVLTLHIMIISFFSCNEVPVRCTESPIIGVVAQELTDEVIIQAFPNATSYIFATYVKAVESSGARVVPIFPGKDETYYRKILTYINGVILPGGGGEFSPGHPYFDAAKLIYEIAIELNKHGSIFPIYGICLGLEFFAVFTTGDKNVLQECSVIRQNCRLRFTMPPLKTRLYSRLDVNQYYTLQFHNSTVNIHSWCLLLDAFSRYDRLRNDWRVTTTSQCGKDEPTFIASMEHMQYPFFATQFHPEVTVYEWSNITVYPRSEHIVYTSRYFYDTFVHFSRQNNHSFEDEGNDEHLIYNYPALYIRYYNGLRRQVYLF